MMHIHFRLWQIGSHNGRRLQHRYGPGRHARAYQRIDGMRRYVRGGFKGHLDIWRAPQ